MDVLEILFTLGLILIGLSVTVSLAADAAGARLSDEAMLRSGDIALWTGMVGATLLGVAMKMAVS